MRIGISRRIGIPHSLLPSYWTQRLIDLDCLFFASDNSNILNKVAATHLPNQVTGSSDFLTVTGVGLNARYRTPDNATYRTADSDYVFWKSDASESTCDGNRLIGYDFPRILVKYLNITPYTIQWIAILKPGVVVTDGMRDAFDLSVWWDNALSIYGKSKQNRGDAKSFWNYEPSAASGLTLTVLTATSIKIDFTDNSGGVATHKIERSINNESNYQVVVTNESGLVTYTDSGLIASTKYYYRIQAVNVDQYSNYCTSVYAITVSSYTLYDTFTDTDGVHLVDHTPEAGSAGIDVSGILVISSNKLVQSVADAWKIHTWELGVANVDYSIDLTIPATLYYAIIVLFRYQDSTHTWGVQFENDGTANPGFKLSLDGADMGSINPLAVTAGNTYRVRILTYGNSIKVYLDGVLKFDITNTTYNDKTKIGLMTYVGGNYVAFPVDNLIVV